MKLKKHGRKVYLSCYFTWFINFAQKAYINHIKLFQLCILISIQNYKFKRLLTKDPSEFFIHRYVTKPEMEWSILTTPTITSVARARPAKYEILNEWQL